MIYNVNVLQVHQKIKTHTLEEPQNIIYAGKYDNCNINYSEKFVKLANNSNSASISSPALLERVDNPARSDFNSNYENLSSSQKPNVVITSFNSTSELISSSTESSKELMTRKTLVDKL